MAKLAWLLASVVLLVEPAEEVAKTFMAVSTVCILVSAVPAVLSAVMPLLMLSAALAYEAILAFKALAIPMPTGSSLALFTRSCVLMR